jgi:SAM-dependent methyltransferase
VTATVTGPGSADGPAVPPPDAAYWQFYERVAAAQLAAWLPEAAARVLDLSDGPGRLTDQLLESGLDVVRVVRPDEPAETRADGRLLTVRADPRRLAWLQDACVDAVVAESQALSMCLAAEVTAQDLHRALRPGGRLLLVVESLATGLARLAEQGRWAELADVPSADVLLVPADDGTITRCFWPEELAGLLGDAGLEVDWVRPRSVLSPAVVERAIAEGGEDALRLLVRTECGLAEERDGESTGLHLIASARRPP